MTDLERMETSWVSRANSGTCHAATPTRELPSRDAASRDLASHARDLPSHTRDSNDSRDGESDPGSLHQDQESHVSQSCLGASTNHVANNVNHV